MSTLIINGSPKGNKGNTEIFINKFTEEIKNPYEVCYVVKVDSLKLANYMKDFDTVLIVMPLYVHAMPGIMMKLIECMKPTLDSEKSMGFIVQSGFMESSQSKYLEKYLSALTRNLNYSYLGTVIRGGSAGTYMMSEKMNKKLFCQLNTLGKYFEENCSFNIEVIEELAKPSELSKSKSKMMQIFNQVGLGDSMFWNMMLKKNNAKDTKFDRPFASE